MEFYCPPYSKLISDTNKWVSIRYLIHKIVKLLTPQEFPGIKQIHAVDAAGVHPLLLAIGQERYMPFRERVPEEILAQATRILGSGQTSLSKFLLIAAAEDDPFRSRHQIERVYQLTQIVGDQIPHRIIDGEGLGRSP
jgi:3-polyprenyl-4-hydroxybenzoate decarboxylase